jgi:hypothetical protein
VGARAGRGARVALPTRATRTPRALAGGTVHSRSRARICAFVTHNTLHSHIAYTRTLYISHLTNRHTRIQRGTHTGMPTKRVHTRETQFLPLCYAVRPTVTPRKVPEPHGRPWPPMAAHGGCSAARSARRTARGARHVARGTWVGGWYVHGTLTSRLEQPELRVRGGLR